MAVARLQEGDAYTIPETTAAMVWSMGPSVIQPRSSSTVFVWSYELSCPPLRHAARADVAVVPFHSPLARLRRSGGRTVYERAGGRVS